MKKKLFGVLFGTALLLGLTTGTAHADNTYPYLEICNSINSRGPIYIIDIYNATSNKTLIVGSCSLRYNGDNRLRIDPDPELGGDVDSTWWGYEGQGYKYCINGEGRIDPPNYYLGYIKYNTDASDC